MSYETFRRARDARGLEARLVKLERNLAPSWRPLERVLAEHPDQLPAGHFPARLLEDAALVGDRRPWRGGTLQVRLILERTAIVEAGRERRLARRSELLIGSHVRLDWQPGRPAELYYSSSALRLSQRRAAERGPLRSTEY